jgi:threonine dehydratase
MTSLLPSYDDVAAAARRIQGHAHRTPVLTSRTLDEALGARVFLKCENLQRMGAFKFRGAFNALSRFSPAQRKAGVVAFSSGNHAQAIALAARLLEIPATIVMPHDAPAAKVAATKGYGGQVLAGQGTAAKELFEEAGPLDALFVPLGGGGLLSGTALSTRALSPDCTLYGVEPEAGNDGQQSLRAGRIVHIDTPKTIADGAQTQHLGSITFPIIQRDVNDILTASDAELVDAMGFLATRMKLVVEPTGCLGLAAARQKGEELRGRRVGIILSGGNVDMQRFCSLLGT